MRAPLLILSLMAFTVLLHQAYGQGSRSRGPQSRRPSTEAPAYDDYYYDEEGAEEETHKKAEKQPASSGSHSRGGSSHGSSSSSSSSSRNKPEPVDDYEEPPQKPSTPKPPPSSSSSSSSRPKPAEPKPAAEHQEQDHAKKNGPISPSTLFLAPRKNRLQRPNVHYAARPRPTLPSFIKSPPALGAISTTELPVRVAATEATRTTAQPKVKTSTTPKSSRFNNGNGGRRKERVTTEPSAASDAGSGSGRRFGKTGRVKNTSRPRFRAGAN
ncbi:uncharacterized protein LOC135395253 [Ornithodoros turicata]|uniref:uncharacterized protein LOC135395253 n=1 Tax=Ornithodoros turicata TaxID=34597 RepID=UPI003139A516